MGSYSSLQSLTVNEYSDVVVRKYLNNAFSDDPQLNLTAAAEEMYVLLRKLMDVGLGGKSDDSKAPLKVIRNAIENITSSRGPDSPEIDALFGLYDRLELLCEERIDQKTDPHGGQMVQDVLRYRLSRLVTSDTWESQPELRLRVLKLMFSFMARERENDRFMGEGRDPSPSLKLGRGLSLGRTRSRDIVPSLKSSKWSDAISEVGRMSGMKLLPLMKLLLLENLQLKACQTGNSEIPGTPAGLNNNNASLVPAQSPSESEGPVSPGPVLVDDLLGLNLEPTAEVDSEVPSQRSSSPSRSSVGVGEDPFAGMAETRRHSVPRVQQGYPTTTYSQTGTHTPSNASVSYTGSAAVMDVQTPHLYPYASSHPNNESFVPSTSSIPIGISGHFGQFAGGHGSFAGSLALASPNHYTSGSLQFPGSAPTTGPELYRQTSGNDAVAHPSSFEANFDAASPHLGNPHPFEHNFFSEVSPMPAQRSAVHNNAPIRAAAPSK